MPLVEFEGLKTRQGREVDVPVAREILGWEVVWRPVGRGRDFLGWHEAWVKNVYPNSTGRQVTYSKLPALSGWDGLHLVLDHLRRIYPRVEIHCLPDGFSVSIEEGDDVTAHFITDAFHPSLPMAVCLSALQLVKEADRV